MERYEYVHLKITTLFGAKSEEHRQIIDKYAQKGCRYAGWIPTNIDSEGKIKELDLIFEKTSGPARHYVFVNAEIHRVFGAKSEEHRKIIEEQSAKGCRFIGFIPTNLNSYGMIKAMDLVFERGI